MDEKKTYVIKKQEDLAGIIRASQAGDSSALEIFLGAPFAVIAGAVTEVLSHGRAAFAGPAVRIVQGAFKGKLFQQFAKEVSDLRKKGKIDESLVSGSMGFKVGSSYLPSSTRTGRTRIDLKP